MTNKLREMSIRFTESGSFRAIIYLAAFAVTAYNVMVCGCSQSDEGTMALLVIGMPVTIALYYISGGLHSFMFVVKKIAGVINFLFGIMLILCPFALGWLMALSTVISFVCCLCWAVTLPVIGVPLVGLVTMHPAVETVLADDES